MLTVTIGTGLGACLTDDGRVIDVVGELEIEKLAQRATRDGRADDVLSARGLADRLGVETSAIQTLVGHPTVVEAIRDHGERLGAFLAPVVAELDVDLVVVGGGLVNAFDAFGSSLRSALGSTRCEPATLGAGGPLLGAALLAFPDRFAASAERRRPTCHVGAWHQRDKFDLRRLLHRSNQFHASQRTQSPRDARLIRADPRRSLVSAS